MLCSYMRKAQVIIGPRKLISSVRPHCLCINCKESTPHLQYAATDNNKRIVVENPQQSSLFHQVFHYFHVLVSYYEAPNGCSPFNFGPFSGH